MVEPHDYCSTRQYISVYSVYKLKVSNSQHFCNQSLGALQYLVLMIPYNVPL